MKQNLSKISKTLLEQFKNEEKISPEGGQGAHIAPKRGQNGPRQVPSGPQGGSRGLQGSPMGPQGIPRGTQRLPKGFPKRGLGPSNGAFQNNTPPKY